MTITVVGNGRLVRRHTHGIVRKQGEEGVDVPRITRCNLGGGHFADRGFVCGGI